MARSSCPNLNDLSSDAWEKLDSDAAQQLEQHALNAKGNSIN